MFSTRSDAERAATSIRQNTALTDTTVRVLPEEDGETTAVTGDHRQHDTGFLASLRNLFIPEEDRYGYAEGMRRGGYMVAVDTEERHTHEVIDVLEQAGAVDLDAQEAQWRQEGWRGYEPSSAATAGASESPAAFGATGAGTASGLGTAGGLGTTGGAGTGGGLGIEHSIGTQHSHGTEGSLGTERSLGTEGVETTSGQASTAPGLGTTGSAGTGPIAGTERGAMREGTGGLTTPAGTEERIPLVEETLRVGKRQVVEGRVRIRSYIVETPVTETVRLRDEHVHVERRPVDRPISADGDPFRERELEATETREEAVVSKDARVREELVMRRTADERDETVKDTVRRTEVREDRGDDVTRDPDTTRTP